ncbi:MAG TPA: type II secretion system F family protein [Chthoniobacterales bacterium]
MAEFVAVIQVSRNGPFLARNLVGKSAGEVTARLLDSGLAVAQVSERHLLHPLAQAKISIKDIVYFMEQLETTLFLGMEPRIALKACAITISQKSKSGRNLQRVVAAMERMVAGGESIANVARQFPNLFNNVAVGLLEAGERSGSMNESLRSIRVLTARTESVRHQISMMLLQPAITLLMATVTVGVMVTYIVPQFRSILDYLGGKLPWQTQLMISISDALSGHRIFFVTALAACTYAFVRLPTYVTSHSWTHRFVVGIPGVGRYLLAGIRTNFIAAFAQLKKNKMTNPTALMLLKDISWYYPYRTAIARASMGLKSGESLANVLAAETDIIGERNIQYFRFIEETGSDVDQLERLAILMNRDLDADTERFRTILNPLILILLAVVVGMIAAAIILPMYEIYNHI